MHKGLLLLVLVAGVWGQEIANVASGGSSLAGIESVALFPKNPAHEFSVKDRSQIYVAFVNGLGRHINVTRAEGYLTDHQGNLVQNLTNNPYGINTPPHVSVTLDYVFKLDTILETQEYNLILEVFFRDGANNFSNVAYNGSIMVTHTEDGALLQDLFLVVALSGIFGGLGYLAYTSFAGDSSSSSSSSSRSRPSYSSSSSSSSSSSAKGTGADSSWLSNTAAAQRKSPKKAKKKKK